jgi:large subunit ribosomal protein L32
MGTPKQRHTRGRTGKRRSHHALGIVKLVKCPKCNSAILPHHMCKVCGTYSGKEVLKIVSKAEKAKAKAAKHKH